MSSIEPVGVFRKRAVLQDGIHGSVPINEFEYWLLQSSPLRRLHGIKQLGFLHLVYPNATHTRLSHSVGVMHVASILAERAARQIIDDANLCATVAERCNWDSMRTLVQLARLAGLLHDVGHLPYSHATEDVIERAGHYSEGNDKLLKSSRAYEEELRKLTNGNGKLKIHELLGYKIILTLAKHIEDTPMGDLESLLLEAAANSIWFPHKAKGVLEALGLKEGAAYIIRDIISHDVVDADRLDYLRRDARHAGVIYGFTDLDRIYNGIRVSITSDRPKIHYDISAQQSIEDVYDSRYKMYKIVYNHHKATALLIAYLRVFPGLAKHWQELAPRDVAHLDLAEELLNPQKLPDLIVEENILFDDSTIDSALKAAVVNNKLEIDRSVRRWSKALIIDRRLLPISLIKRQDELAEILSRKVEKAGIEAKARILSEVVKTLLSKEAYVSEVVAREASKFGVSADEVNLDIIQRSIDSRGGEKSGVLPSIYLTTLRYLSSIGFAQAYIYSENEESHLRLYKVRKTLQSKFKEILEEIFDEVIKRDPHY